MRMVDQASPTCFQEDQPEKGSGDGAAAARWARASLLADIFWPTTRPWLDEKLKPFAGLRGLHVECGNGEDTLRMAHLLGGKAILEGIDADVLRKLRSREPDQPYDFAVARWGTCRRKVQEDWLAGLSRALVPGGTLFLEIMDPAGFRAWPYNFAFSRAMELLGRREAGGSVEPEDWTGRLAEAGFSVDDTGYSAPTFLPPSASRIASLSLLAWKAGILDLDQVKEEELDALLLELRIWEPQEGTLISRPGIWQIAARKQR